MPERRGGSPASADAVLAAGTVAVLLLVVSLAAAVLADAAAIVRAERERFDGKGYPYGLAGDEIPLSARILHACDAFVAMTTPRPYRRSVSPDLALGELRRHAARQFDPMVVDALSGFVTERH